MSKPLTPLVYNKDQLLTDLDALFIELQKRREDVKRTVESPAAPTFFEDFSTAGIAIQTHLSVIKERLEQLFRFPPHLARYLSKLSDFHQAAPYEDSVFIMTKLPDRGSPMNPELLKVIETVKGALTKCGLYPRVATDMEYHDRIWDNVALYLLGCGKGVAILESHVRTELNPNVAVEVGWMKALDKDVLLLVENDFGEMRADWLGLIEHRFSWERPEEDIPREIGRWLGKLDSI